MQNVYLSGGVLWVIQVILDNAKYYIGKEVLLVKNIAEAKKYDNVDSARIEKACYELKINSDDNNSVKAILSGSELKIFKVGYLNN